MINRYELIEKAQQALQRINANKQSKLLTESKDNFHSNYLTAIKQDLTKLAFEEYDENVMHNKSTIDSYYFKILTENAPSEYVAEIQTIINNLYDTSKKIYEQINIKPKSHGFDLKNALNESEAILEKQAKNYINNYFKENYYALDKEQRVDRFYSKVKPIAEQLVLENHMNEEEALKFGFKTILVENLISKICFPNNVREYIEECLHDQSFAEMFEQQVLQDNWDSFNKQVYNLSKIVAYLI